MRKLVATIATFFTGSFVYFLSKLLYFFVPGVDVYGGPNLWLFLLGNCLALWAMVKLGAKMGAGDRYSIGWAIGLYTLYQFVRLVLVPAIPWYFYVMQVLLGLLALLYLRRII